MKHPGRLLRALALTVLLTLLAAPWGALAEEPVVITTSVDELVVAVGRKADYKLRISPAAARRAGYTFTTTDESVAVADANGLVKGVAPGTCQLVITSDYDPSVSKRLTVTVVVPVRRVTAKSSADAVRVGETAVITAAFSPENATEQRVTYASSKEDVATVDANGVVTGVGKGQAVITVRSADGYAKTQVRIRVRQQPESVSVRASAEQLTAGRRYALTAEVLPKNADNKQVTWTSSDETIAKVNARGQVMALAPGQVTFTAICADDPAVTGSLMLPVARLAKSVSFDQKTYAVTIYQSAPTSVTVGPADATNKAVTYKSNKPKVVSVDENGVLTALAPGKATITVTTADGSRRSGRATVQVIVPVTGVSFKHPDIRVPAGGYNTYTADIQPKEATNKNMTWTSSDESIARVSGATNRVRVTGKRWGRCQITGVTEDGGFSCSVFVDVGSLRRAVTVHDVYISNGWPCLTLRNNSNMHITRVYVKLTGTDADGFPVTLSSRDGSTLYGVYEYGLSPGERTRERNINLRHASNCWNMESLSAAVTGWETDTGYYGTDGLLYYSYQISDGNLLWETYESSVFKARQSEASQ